MVSRTQFIVVFMVLVTGQLSSAQESTHHEKTEHHEESALGECASDAARLELCNACPLANCCTSHEAAEVCYLCDKDETSEACDELALDNDDDSNDDSDDLDKRARRLIGKRGRRLIGKRGRRLIGKRGRKLIGKRGRKLIG